MKRHISVRFLVETGLTFLSAVLLITTVMWRDWIEVVFGVDPDAGSGALEWIVVAVTATLLVVFFGLARSEWRRMAAQPA